MHYCDRVAKYPLTLLPAVSVAHGSCPFPQLPGPAGPLEYGTPAQVVSYWVGQRAPWVHLIDLDSEAGHGDNHLAIGAATGASLEVSGGLRDDASLGLALDGGCARAVIDSSDLEWAARAIARYGSRVAACVDVRDPDWYHVVAKLDAAGVARYLVVDAPGEHHFWRHGDRHLLAELCDATDAPVTAMGGIAHLDDLHRLHELVGKGLDAIVINDPLYDGSFTYAEACAASADRFDLFYWGPGEF